jgi:hypothetical protein
LKFRTEQQELPDHRAMPLLFENRRLTASKIGAAFFP